MKRIVVVLLWFHFVILLLCSTICQAEVYGYQDKEGRWHFPDLKGESVMEAKGQRQDIDTNVYVASYMPIILEACRKYDISPAFVKAIIMAESAYDRTAVSKKGAKGLMQLMPETARRLNVGNPFSPQGNIEGGVQYLKYLLERFHNDLVLAAAAYNAGPARVEAASGIPPIPETRQFVQNVLYFYYQFKYAETN